MISHPGRVYLACCVLLAMLFFQPRTSSRAWAEEVGNDADAGTAGAVLLEGDEALAEGRLVDAALSYMQVLDSFPDSPEAAAAFEGARRLDKVAVANPSRLDEVVEELYSRLPRPDEMRSTPARYTVNTLYYLRAQHLRHTGRLDDAARAQKECVETALHIMELDPDSPYHIGTAGIYMEARKRMDDDEGRLAAASLESFVVGKPDSMSIWACRFQLVKHYLHEGRSRRAAETHLVRMVGEDAQMAVEAALSQPHVMDWVKSMIRWSQGYALLEQHRYQEAIDRFDQIRTEWTDVRAPGKWGGSPAHWAELAIPIAVTRKNPTNPVPGIQAYEEFLTQHPGNPYTDFARLDLGRLHARAGDHDKARACFSEISLHGSHIEAVEAASKEIERLDKLRDASTD